MKLIRILRIPLLFIVVSWAVSCKAPAELPKVEAKPISTNRLLKKVEENAFNYEYLTIKNIRCNFSSSTSKATFKINLKTKQDEKILVSISKLNIPVGRVLLTPDSVKYVNYIDHEYFIDDYTFLNSFLHIDVDFGTIQSIISNNAFSYRNDPKNKDYRTFKSFIESNMYVLQSEKEKKIDKLDEKNKVQKIERRLKRLDDQALIIQRMFFAPESFSLTKLELDDKTNRRNMYMTFSDFVQVENMDYPSTMNLNFLSPEEKLNMKIKLSGFSTDEISSFELNIPEKYEQIHVK